MNFSIDYFENISEVEFSFRSADEEKYLRTLLDEANGFIKRQNWCKAIIAEKCGLVCDGAFGVFLFEIMPANSSADNFIWVIVGDLPPAYITCDDAKNAIAAVNLYLGAMDCWVEAVLNGKSVSGLIPVDAAPTKENALSLKGRLDWIGDNVVKPNLEWLPKKP